MDAPDPDTLVDEQAAYYRAVAPDYDEFDKRDATQIDRAELEEALAQFDPRGDVLELAGGTGAWTLQLAEYAGHLTVVDASAETLAINRAKTGRTTTPVEYVVADVFDWRPERRFDVVFFSFWLTHVPPARFDGFWQVVEESLLPGGRVFFIDNAPPVLEAGDHVMRDHPERGVSQRARIGTIVHSTPSAGYGRGRAAVVNVVMARVPVRSAQSEPSICSLGAWPFTGAAVRLSQLQVSAATYRARTDPVRRSPRSIRPLRSCRRCSRGSDVDRRSQVP